MFVSGRKKATNEGGFAARNNDRKQRSGIIDVVNGFCVSSHD
jgi:hypothetical protein